MSETCIDIVFTSATSTISITHTPETHMSDRLDKVISVELPEHASEKGKDGSIKVK